MSNLHQRLVSVMRSMGAVGKGGKTNYGDRFEYHRIDDIDEKLRHALVEHGVVATIIEIRDRRLEHFDEMDKYGKPRTTWYAECLIQIELVNADDPKDRQCIVGWGQGLDYGDKATGKAISYAAKSAYLSAFHLRGQPDSEEDNIARSKSQHVPPAEIVVVTEEQQSWIDAISQCDCVDSLESLEKFYRKESAELQSAVDGYFFDAEVHCWSLDMNRCQGVKELASVGEKLRNKPERLQNPLRKVYAAKYAALNKKVQL